MKKAVKIMIIALFFVFMTGCEQIESAVSESLGLVPWETMNRVTKIERIIDAANTYVGKDVSGMDEEWLRAAIKHASGGKLTVPKVLGASFVREKDMAFEGTSDWNGGFKRGDILLTVVKKNDGQLVA